jgi:hypothetical protein
MSNRPTEIDDDITTLPPEPDAGPALDSSTPFREPTQPRPMLEVHAQLPLVLRESGLDLDGQAEVTWSQGKIPGTASVRLAIRVPVETYEHAEHLDAVLHGALALYSARAEASGQHVQRVQFGDSDLVWRASEMGNSGEVGIPTTWTAPPSSMTFTVSNGGCTLTVATKFSVPIADIARADGLSRGRVHLTATAAQLAMTYGGGDDPANPPATPEVVP